jgi:hypothetical protein
VDLLASVYDQLTPGREERLREEAALPGGVLDGIACWARTPYPLDRETAAALRAAGGQFVLPWDIIISHGITRWVVRAYEELGHAPAPGWVRDGQGADLDYVRACFPDEGSFRDFMAGEDFTHGLAGVRDAELEAKAEEVEDGMDGLVDAGEVQGGHCVRLECVPLDDWLLKFVPLVEGKWVDGHWLVLIETCALLTERGYERLPAADPHPLAWERFYPSGTDWCDPVEADPSVLRSAAREARQHLEGFRGGTRDIGGRTYLCFEDYLRWPRRKVAGDLGSLALPEPGLVVKSWNGWAEAPSRAGGAHLCWVPVGDLPHPNQDFGDADMNIMEAASALEAALAARQEAMAGLFKLGMEVARARGADETVFVPGPLQQQIYDALFRRQLTTGPLLRAVGCHRKRLFSPSGLSGLLNVGLVKNNDDRKGYFRPDALPLLGGTGLPQGK